MDLDIKSIKDSFNIVDVISTYVDIKKAGANYHACCPFHSEKTPSFTVSEPKQFYHCFGCGASGDVIGFVQEMNGVEFIDAVNILTGNKGDDNYKFTPAPKKAKRLPLNQKSASDRAISALKSQNGFMPIKDIDGFTVNAFALSNGELSMLDGNFIFGGYYFIGKLSRKAYVACNLNKAIELNKMTGVCAICIFTPENLHYIKADLQSKGIRMTFVAETKECLIQADKYNLPLVFYKDLDAKVNMDTNEFIEELINKA